MTKHCETVPKVAFSPAKLARRFSSLQIGKRPLPTRTKFMPEASLLAIALSSQAGGGGLTEVAGSSKRRFRVFGRGELGVRLKLSRARWQEKGKML